MTLPQTLKSALREHLPELVQTLQNWPWLDTVRTLRVRFREDRLGLTAGSLTFTTLISLVPLFTVMLAVFSAFPLFASFQESLQKYFLQSLVPDSIARQVLGSLKLFSSKAKGVGTLGLILLVVAAVALMLTIDRTLNHIWRVRTPRPIAQRVLVYWAALTLGPLVLGVSLSATSYAISVSRGFVSALPGGVTLLLFTTQVLMLATALGALFHYVPNTHVRWRHALAGGLCSAVGFEIAKKLLGWYLTTVPTYSMIYGAFATVPILFIWIYLGWMIVLTGAVIAAYAPSLKLRGQHSPDAPGAALQLALGVLREMVAAQTQGAGGLSSRQLAQTLRIDPLHIQPIMQTLTHLGWAGRLEEPGDSRWVLLCDPAHTRAGPLLAQLLLQPARPTQRLWQRAGFDDWTLQNLLED
jgi:membrane protein